MLQVLTHGFVNYLMNIYYVLCIPSYQKKKKKIFELRFLEAVSKIIDS